MRLPRGTRLGTYEILDSLGAGGMGEVYRARDTRLRRDVAIKVLPEEVASDPDRLARLEREARLVAGLNHPNIVTLFSVEDEEGVRFLTMELVEGQTLSNLVVPGGLPLPRLLELMIPLADALAAAHERGVVHRDLKPGNVMVTREGRLKVLDFGLAKAAPVRPDPDSETATTVTDATDSGAGQVMGTIPYISPEQLRGEPVDYRSDLFAFGILLYELATGRRPFAGATPAEVVSSILRDTPEALARIRADLPADFERVVSHCLVKNPRERAQSALDVFNELRRLKRSLERGGATVVAKAESPGTASIAVLPFVNRSRDEEDEYFSDGLADELLNVLSGIRGLRVVARASSFQFKGRHEDPAVMGAKLNVSTLLDGSVRRAGSRVRISVQLVKVSDGCHLWSKTYDRTLEDIFAVQDDIAQSVVKELCATLLGGDAAPDTGRLATARVADAVKGRTTDPEAHRLYLLARHLLDRSTREDVATAIRHLENALALDPKFALAWAELGGAYASEAIWGLVPLAEGYARAREAVQRALSLEPDLAEGHARMGSIQMSYDWDWRGAEVSYSRALEVAPGNALALHGAGALAADLGHFEKAIGLFQRSLERDPLSATSYIRLGGVLHQVGRFTESEGALRMALELSPRRAVTHALLSLTLLAQSRGEEALAEANRESLEWLGLWALTIIYFELGRSAESDEALRALIDKNADQSGTAIAEVYAVRGETDSAFEWLERAYAKRDGNLREAKTSPRLRSLQGDPRWGVFMNKMGFKE